MLSDEAQALYQDGILRLRFPKTPEAKPIKIPVNTVGEARAVATAAPEQIEAAAGKKRGK